MIYFFGFVFASSHAFRALGPTVTLKGGVVMPSLGLGSAVSRHIRALVLECFDALNQFTAAAAAAAAAVVRNLQGGCHPDPDGTERSCSGYIAAAQALELGYRSFHDALSYGNQVHSCRAYTL